MTEKLKTNNPFFGVRSDGFVSPGFDAREDDIVEYEDVEEVETLSDDPADFIIHHVTKETQRYNRQEYIDSFRNDVGILNILKKVALNGGDTSAYNYTGSSDIVDITHLQTDTETALKTMADGVKDYKNLDTEIKGNSIDDFMSKVDADALNKWIAKKLAEKSGAVNDASTEGDKK